MKLTNKKRNQMYKEIQDFSFLTRVFKDENIVFNNREKVSDEQLIKVYRLVEKYREKYEDLLQKFKNENVE